MTAQSLLQVWQTKRHLGLQIQPIHVMELDPLLKNAIFIELVFAQFVKFEIVEVGRPREPDTRKLDRDQVIFLFRDYYKISPVI